MNRLNYLYRYCCLFIGEHHKVFFALALLAYAFYVGWTACAAFVVLIAVLAFIARQAPVETTYANDDDWHDDWKGI